jgi:hypothetical protein
MAWQIEQDTIGVVHELDHVCPRVFIASKAVQEEMGWVVGAFLAAFGIAETTFTQRYIIAISNSKKTITINITNSNSNYDFFYFLLNNSIRNCVTA